jgi:hypothetical protein
VVSTFVCVFLTLESNFITTIITMRPNKQTRWQHYAKSTNNVLYFWVCMDTSYCYPYTWYLNARLFDWKFGRGLINKVYHFWNFILFALNFWGSCALSEILKQLIMRMVRFAKFMWLIWFLRDYMFAITVPREPCAMAADKPQGLSWQAIDQYIAVSFSHRMSRTLLNVT